MECWRRSKEKKNEKKSWKRKKKIKKKIFIIVVIFVDKMKQALLFSFIVVFFSLFILSNSNSRSFYYAEANARAQELINAIYSVIGGNFTTRSSASIAPVAYWTFEEGTGLNINQHRLLDPTLLLLLFLFLFSHFFSWTNPSSFAEGREGK